MHQAKRRDESADRPVVGALTTRTLLPAAAPAPSVPASHASAPLRRSDLFARADGEPADLQALRDLAERGPGDERLRQRLAEQQTILDGLQVGVGYFVERRVVWVNRRWEAMFQRSMEEVHRLGTSVYFRSHAEWIAFGERAYPGLALGEDVTEDLEFRRSDGSTFWCRVRGMAVNKAEPLKGAVWIYEDVTDKRRSEEAMRLALSVMEHSRDAIFVADPALRVLRVNPAFARILGWREDEVVGHRMFFLKTSQRGEGFHRRERARLMESGSWEGEHWARKRSGEEVPVWLSLSAVRGPDERITHIAAVLSDISERKRYEAHLEHLARHDPLTGLPNRQYLLATLERETGAAAVGKVALAVLFIDLDRFKIVNDTLGHSVGDELLCAVAHRLRACLDERHVLARLGGDEFTVLAPFEGKNGVETLARRLVASMVDPFVVASYELMVTVSIGISLCPRDGARPAELLMRADNAMYRAKERGRNNFQFYEPSMGRRAQRLHLLERELRHALTGQQLVLHYQPKVELASGRCVGMEALIRWEHPGLGAVSPAEFIPVAEEIGAIVPIGEWAMREACRQVAAWRAIGRECSVAVNLSSRQFRQPDLASTILRVIDEAGAPCELIELEITEGVLMEDTNNTVATLTLLAARGIRIAVDDFGIGYSSLGYLRRFPVHVLKIDRCFVSDIGRPGGDTTIARTIIAMAHALNLEVVAEGVEDAAQVDFLRQQGCDTAQGYFFGRPVPAEAATRMLLQHGIRR